ncbi:uncharacterized protein ARMOST_15079 [Armillaria ostoyae]|uniref:Heterokaryon incompatibility domain-containing protein n=1 Tax=Armillaria ostoyae TaxID=47428 RepID=A0A284RSD8_ARMOS|nr:uncharacterized protein ARMOST_15079 [Armillaria ostoyae]
MTVPSSKPVPARCAVIWPRENDRFQHQREEKGRPSISSVEDVFGADIAAGRVDDVVVDGETGSMRVHLEQPAAITLFLPACPTLLRERCQPRAVHPQRCFFTCPLSKRSSSSSADSPPHHFPNMLTFDTRFGGRLHWRQICIQQVGYINPSRRDNKTYYLNLSNVTIIAPIEDGLSIQDIKVPKQRAYTGSKPVIPSSLADTPSASLGVDGLMKMLNSTLSTKYDLTPSLSSLLEAYISDEYDFGTIYGYLRPIWLDCDLDYIQNPLRSSEATDLEIRQEAVVDGQITEEGLFMAPRRVWDLFSNRVVPWWVALQTPWGISHAWVDISHRKNVLTPINGHQWPVPIPEDANLDLIRIEMLNLGAEYAWLDVLCLRQEGGQNENLRAGEWMLDVPTIGNAYVEEKVVCYFNGLGRPLEHGFNPDSGRSWFKRTWTLQETSRNWTIGGDTGDEMLNEEVRASFESQLVSVEGAASSLHVVHYLSLLRDRTSEKDVDKVAALTYFLAFDSSPAHNETRPAISTTHDFDPISNDNSIRTGDPTSTMVPAYSEQESAEDAWKRW